MPQFFDAFVRNCRVGRLGVPYRSPMSTPPLAPATSRTVHAAARSSGSPLMHRLYAGAVACCCSAVLGLAAWMTPSETGIGTHEQLNMPSCGWIAMGNLPCPTCGMTTAFAHAADGDLVSSFLTQPMGCLLAIATAMALVVSVYVLVTGSRITSVFTRYWNGRTAWIVAMLVVAAWGYKIITYRGML